MCCSNTLNKNKSPTSPQFFLQQGSLIRFIFLIHCFDIVTKARQRKEERHNVGLRWKPDHVPVGQR